MKLLLERQTFTSSSTLGELSIDGVSELFSLENPLVGQKPHVAIPAGTYEVVLTTSPHFSRPHGPRICPRLLNVPGFDGVLIHAGNSSKDTLGCILVGQEKGPDAVYKSRRALAKLIIQMWRRRKEGITITIQ